MPSYKNILKYLYGLQRHGIRPGLERIASLLSNLGDPQRAYQSIHVAGTNGKGSTSAMLESILIEAGLSIGLYTSPHLVRFSERIRVNGTLIPDRDVIRVASIVKKASEGLKDEPTFFEFTTAMAFVYFKEKKVDLAVLEAGMGGRLDATNVVTPLVSVITNVGLDHMEYLGDDIRKIAREKAGIIKKNIPVVTACEEPGAIREITLSSRKKGSPLHILKKDFRTKDTPAMHRGRNPRDAFDYHGIRKNISGLELNLKGRHQCKNAACAIAALEIIASAGVAVSEGAVRKGLKKVLWPARVEVIKKKPLLILDAAHNPAGARTLREALLGLRFKRLLLVLGIMADKDIDGILKELAPMAEIVFLTVPRTERAAGPDILLEKLAPYNKKAVTVSSVARACDEALSEAKGADAVCVTGSIFTVGEAKKYLEKRFKKACPSE